MLKFKSRIFFIAFFAVALTTVVAWAIYLPKTGQTICYDQYGYETLCNLASANPNAPLAGQDALTKAGVDLPSPRFQDNNDGTITDNLTGLMWLKDADCGGTLIFSTGEVVWQQAFNFINDINGGFDISSCGGYSKSYADWRLPNANELQSLFNNGYAEGGVTDCSGYSCDTLSDWLVSKGHFSNVQWDYYWSSTTFANLPTQAWSTSFINGSTAPVLKTGMYFVWPVRGPVKQGAVQIPQTGQAKCYNSSGVEFATCTGTGQDGDTKSFGAPWPPQRFSVDSAGKAVTDNLTGLMWLKDANCINTISNPPYTPFSPKYQSNQGPTYNVDGRVSWMNAQDFASSIDTTYASCSGGYTGWRLPNVNELRSLLNYAESDNTAWLNSPSGLLVFAPISNMPLGSPPSGVFNNVKADYYWSSTNDSQYKDSLIPSYAYFSPSATYYAWASWAVPMCNTQSITSMLKDFYYTSPINPDYLYVGDVHYVWPVRDTPNILVDKTSLSFGTVNVGVASSQNVTINNTGTSELVISSVSFSTSASGKNISNAFTVTTTSDLTSENVCPTIPKGGSCTFKVILTPNFAGPKDTNLVISSNDPDSPNVFIPLFGTGKSTLNVSINGGGTVTGTSINCPGECTEVYDPAVSSTIPTSLTLTATPNLGNKFASWTGCPSASGNQCTVDPGKNNSVTANFEFIPIVPVVYNLKISPTGPGSGTIMSTPSGINCSFDGTNVSGDCSKSYDSNQMVTLTAKPLIDSTGKTLSSLFTGWGNACSGTKPCLVKMDSEKTVSANFDLNKPVISVDLTDNALDFGSVKPGKLRNKAIKVTNGSTKGALTISAAIIDGDIDSFSQRLGGKMTIKPGKVYGLRVMFKPKSKGPKSATLRITSNDPDHPTTDIKLTGTGL